ncbi:MAG: LysR substrate-binding domain-containing protein [Burkholderiaceae bacterium]|nr:LysR substrate-binding domain-containing protein [Burkholderiaceae bacterium]MDP1968994.1 LysR substrate-binding domain-containing protein [Burkholderiaceae bacterium]
MLELRHLHQFIAVAEELGFRRAAERLHMSQPPLSQSIKQIEALVGAELFSRSKQHVELTPAGAAFLKQAYATLAQARLAVHAAQRAAKGISGTLRLSFVGSASLNVVPPLLREFSRAYPSVELVLAGNPTAQQVAALKRGDIDLALIVSPFPEGQSLKITPLRTEPMILAVPHGHPLEKSRRRVKLASLKNESFITFGYADGPGFVSTFIDACKKTGFAPRIVQESPQMNTLLAMVAGGIGVAVLPGAMRMVVMPHVSYVSLSASPAELKYTLAFATRRDIRNPVVDAFIALGKRIASSARISGVAA